MKKGTHQDGMINDYIIYRHVYIYIYIYTHILIGQVRLFFFFWAGILDHKHTY